MDRKDKRQFEQFARRALKGVRESTTFLQLYSPNVDPAKDPAFALQLGAAVLLEQAAPRHCAGRRHHSPETFRHCRFGAVLHPG
jgi:hypothetical protein